MSERKEALMRIPVGVVSGAIIGIWKIPVLLASIFHLFYVLFKSERSTGIAQFCNLWTAQVYRLVRYMTFTTNARPFPFSDLGKILDPIEMKK